jgi:FtsZ-interacting cell division protein ZipA
MREYIMDPLVIGIIVIAALAIVGVVLWQQQRTRRLQTRYVSEYDRTVAELGRRKGEAELVNREERVRQLDIRPLSAAERERFVADWRRVQEQFVDDPRGAVTRGDQLVDEVMRARGYPIADFDRQIADLSVDHSRVVNNYRTARDIAYRHQRGEASTEDLRQAMVLYRELFEDLLETGPTVESETERVVETPIERADARSVERARRYGRDRDSEVRP